jgi:hypothetical protein
MYRGIGRGKQAMAEAPRHSGAAAATATLQLEPTCRVLEEKQKSLLLPSLTGCDPPRTLTYRGIEQPELRAHSRSAKC